MKIKRISLHYAFALTLPALLLVLFGCTPSPKYRGYPSEGDREKSQPVSEINDRDLKILNFRYPVRGFSRDRINSNFGLRSHPRLKTTEFHQGIDIRSEYGEDVLASSSGSVEFVGRQAGYGNVIIIDHGKRICTVYAHLSRVFVEKSDLVKSGEVIGLVGESGNSTGTHLHFEIRIKGKAVDPMNYL